MDRRDILIPLVTKLAWELFNDSDSDDDDEVYVSARRVIAKNTGFFEETVPRFDDQQFKVHFRLSPQTYELLFKDLLSLSRHTDVKLGQPPLNFEKQILIALWYLANTECFRSVADRFGVSPKACWNAVYFVCNCILRFNREQKIIAWPTAEKAMETSNYFLRKTNFPGVIGCIDGSHISIPAPKVHPESYFNRKKYHSVLLQGVCDEKLIFTDCYTGEAGSIHDSCMFRRSNLYKRISDGSVTIPYEQHILGDQGYGLKPYLLIPFKNNGHLSEAQKIYNQTLSSIRVVIERAFGLLKNRFRRLYGLQIRKPELIPLIIMTACILHNVCLKQGDWFDFNFVQEEESDIVVSPNQQDLQGQAKRNQIVQQLIN